MVSLNMLHTPQSELRQKYLSQPNYRSSIKVRGQANIDIQPNYRYPVHYYLAFCHSNFLPSCHSIILSTCHYTILPSHHPAIISSCHPVILTSYHPIILLSYHPATIILSSCHLIILSSWHSIILPFHHPAIPSFCHYIILSNQFRICERYINNNIQLLIFFISYCSLLKGYKSSYV